MQDLVTQPWLVNNWFSGTEYCSFNRLFEKQLCAFENWTLTPGVGWLHIFYAFSVVQGRYVLQMLRTLVANDVQTQMYMFT